MPSGSFIKSGAALTLGLSLRIMLKIYDFPFALADSNMKNILKSLSPYFNEKDLSDPKNLLTFHLNVLPWTSGAT